jgi:hypothetical protein
MRDLYVLIDDLPEQTMSHGDIIRLPLPAGEHRIKVTNRLFSKVETFHLDEGETVRFMASNKAMGGLFSVMVVIGGTGAYTVTLERESPVKSG